MKSFIVALLAVMVMATGAMAAESEGWVEIRQAVDYNDLSYDENKLVAEAVYRHKIVGPLGIDTGVVGNPTKDWGNLVLSFGPQINVDKGFLIFDSFEASATTSFTSNDAGEVFKNGMLRLRGNF